MIYCVVPRALENELYERLAKHYQADPNVEVIVDRREAGERRAAGARRGAPDATDDRRRRRVAGTFPPIEAGE